MSARSAGSAVRAVGRILRAPFTAQTWFETMFVLLSLPVAIAGFVFAVAAISISASTLIILVGIPLLLLSLLVARWIGAFHRSMRAALTGVHIAPPASPPRAEGIVQWAWVRLKDLTAWRAMAFNILQLPVAVVAFSVALLAWTFAISGVTYPLWRPLMPCVDPNSDACRQGIFIGQDMVLDAPPQIAAVAALGALMLLAVPWIVRAVLNIDEVLAVGLLGPTSLTQRIRDLEDTRSHAVGDAAATLRRIERDLHDGAQARLVALAMNLGRAQEQLRQADDRAAEAPSGDDHLGRARDLVDRAHADAKEAMAELRDLARGIHPPVLDQGLAAALSNLAGVSAIPVDLRVDVNHRPPPAIETLAYYCTAELLTNAARHAEATNVSVVVRQHGQRLQLHVTDDGNGGAQISSGPGAGTGLAGLADRVRTVDGTMDISSPVGGPTRVTIDLPAHG